MEEIEDAGDQAHEDQNLSQVVEAVRYLASQYDSLKDRLDQLEDYFQNKFVGGLMQMIDDQNDAIGAEDLKATHGDMFAPFEMLHSKLHPMSGGSPDEDIYSHVFRTVKHLDGDARENALKEIAEKMASIRDGLGPLLGSKPAEAQVEVEEEPEEGEGEEEGGELGDLIRDINKMKGGKKPEKKD
jgi:hypothetical protein